MVKTQPEFIFLFWKATIIFHVPVQGDTHILLTETSSCCNLSRHKCSNELAMSRKKNVVCSRNTWSANSRFGKESVLQTDGRSNLDGTEKRQGALIAHKVRKDWRSEDTGVHDMNGLMWAKNSCYGWIFLFGALRSPDPYLSSSTTFAIADSEWIISTPILSISTQRLEQLATTEAMSIVDTLNQGTPTPRSTQFDPASCTSGPL